MAAAGKSDADSKFNLVIVRDALKNSLIEDDDVQLDSYIVAYKELLKFFHLLGSVFSFVSSDVENKIEILQQFRAEKESSNFVSLKTMILYEKSSGLLNNSKYVSGSRTFLRLHRGLDFIRLFLTRVKELNDKDKTSGVCQSAYDETLGNFHPFLIRKGAKAAMYVLPTKEGLLQKVCGSKEEVEAASLVLPEMLDVMGEVHKRSNNLYDKHDLHGLP
ncbi:ceramide-1-phosphate transfer protein [Schistocerca cancellata]|uniref:ceramide-1-phosphate transfer protein n=1 Tax=Schistocerca cancellata TaxID=274614 RepID=UPI0021185BAE|nr:ceramide-1-phosphate transfer protein [Schistocerca cancellata]